MRQYHGPGAVATALFKEHGIRAHMRAPEIEIELAAQRAYFGGRFEQFKAGHHAKEVYLYDINSAYPYHISELPSLDGAEWEYSETFIEGEIGVWNCSYEDYNKDFYKPHPLPWRGEKGEVGFPANNKEVWLWHPEAKYATTVNYGYILRIKNETKPFAFVKEMFEKRRVWKAEGKGGERALKLGMNSLYGKMCQRIGGNPDRYEGRPAWHQIEWAGIVTSATRAQLWEAIQLNPTKIISVETDSICSSVPLDLDIGPGLGQWEETKYDWITYIQSGIYFTSTEATGMKSKTRGIDVTQLDHDEMLEFLDGDQTEPLQVNSRQFIGIGNPRTYLYGQWQDSTKDVKVAGDKRRHIKEMCHACKRGDSMAKKTHNLAAAMHYGLTPSAKHPLPWLDGKTEPEPEFQYAGDAIQEFDKERKAGKTLAEMIASVK